MKTENLSKKSKFFPVNHNLKMYSVKSYYEIKLMHLLTIAIFAHSVKIQRTFFFFFFLIAIANDCEIT